MSSENDSTPPVPTASTPAAPAAASGVQTPAPAPAPEEDERTQLITQYKAKVKEHREVEAK